MIFYYDVAVVQSTFILNFDKNRNKYGNQNPKSLFGEIIEAIFQSNRQNTISGTGYLKLRAAMLRDYCFSQKHHDLFILRKNVYVFLKSTKIFSNFYEVQLFEKLKKNTSREDLNGFVFFTIGIRYSSGNKRISGTDLCFSYFILFIMFNYFYQIFAAFI